MAPETTSVVKEKVSVEGDWPDRLKDCAGRCGRLTQVKAEGTSSGRPPNHLTFDITSAAVPAECLWFVFDLHVLDSFSAHPMSW
jgi:hypothetical protein